MANRLPIVYVRGFGGGPSGIDSVVDDPFYGFNAGSTHIRVGSEGRPRYYQFEGPVVRLLTEEGYVLGRGGSADQLTATGDGGVAPASIWIYRFYDPNASTYDRPAVAFKIEDAAAGLVDYVRAVRRVTGAPAVNLVAHSMGGLICRSAMQRYMTGGTAGELVSKLMTIGTPHGGIDPELGGDIGDWVIERFGPNGSDIFGRPRMAEYLLPDDGRPRDPDDWDPRTPVGGLDAARTLCVVGTNARDYDVAKGLSALAMGAQSDGLVAIRNAWVQGAARAYVHRSHSGRYGLVNSEEVYQNLKRFLFGSLKVEVFLAGLQLDAGKNRLWQADVRLAVRGVPVLMHEQSAEHHCPVDLLRAQAGQGDPDPLATMFLVPRGGERSRYALSLKVLSLVEHDGLFQIFDHLEQIADWEDTLVVDIALGDEKDAGRVRWQWNSTLAGRIADTDTLERALTWDTAASTWNVPMPLPDTARSLLGPDATVQVSVTGWS